MTNVRFRIGPFDMYVSIPLVALAFLLSSSAVAAESLLLSGQFDAKQRTARLTVARELLADVDRFANLVQSPRPSEVAWVEAEQASIAKIKNPEDSTSRSIQLLYAAEFQQLNVYRHAQEMRNALKCVIESPATLQREMFCWAAASYLLDDSGVFNDGVRVLMRAKRLPEDTPNRVGAATEEGISFRYRFLARGIQQYLVLPYLRGEIK